MTDTDQIAAAIAEAQRLLALNQQLLQLFTGSKR